MIQEGLRVSMDHYITYEQTDTQMLLIFPQRDHSPNDDCYMPVFNITGCSSSSSSFLACDWSRGFLFMLTVIVGHTRHCLHHHRPDLGLDVELCLHQRALSGGLRLFCPSCFTCDT